MEIDDPQAEIEATDDRDSDIEVLACFKESPKFISQPVAGRYMTTELCGGLVDISLPEGLYGPSTKGDSEPTSELVDLVLGHNPPLDSFSAIEDQPIGRCAQIEPIPDTQFQITSCTWDGTKRNFRWRPVVQQPA